MKPFVFEEEILDPLVVQAVVQVVVQAVVQAVVEGQE